MALHTATVSGQQLGKHFPVAKQQILNNSTIGSNTKIIVFSMWSVSSCYKQGTK
jgi:hypothetical protein